MKPKITAIRSGEWAGWWQTVWIDPVFGVLHGKFPSWKSCINMLRFAYSMGTVQRFP